MVGTSRGDLLCLEGAGHARPLGRRAVRRAALIGVALVAGLGARPAAAADGGVFDAFVSPVSNPVNFEDPRATTELRPIYIYHRIPGSFVTGGGDVNIVALQARYAVTDRFALIATKDGYLWLRPEQVLPNGDGFANLAFGAKYSLLRDPERRTIVTAGLRYEVALGNQDVLQGKGDGIFNPFVSALWGTGNLHLLGYTGARLPVSRKDSMFFDLSLHVDYGFGPFYPLAELNWVQVVRSGERLAIDSEGFDFFNLGAENAGGGVVTTAFGARWRFVDRAPIGASHAVTVDLGAVGEFPITSRQDLFDWRVTTDLVLRFDKA